MERSLGFPQESRACVSSSDEELAMKHPHPDSIPLGFQDCDLPEAQISLELGYATEPKSDFLQT